MQTDMVKVRLKALAMPEIGGNPLIILEDESSGGTVAVSVGAWEAGTIIMELEHISPPRPMTYSLFTDILKEQGIHLVRAELFGVYGSKLGEYLARIVYKKGICRWKRDVRPSDALALAISSGAMLFAHRALVLPPDKDWLNEDWYKRGGYRVAYSVK